MGLGSGFEFGLEFVGCGLGLNLAEMLASTFGMVRGSGLGLGARMNV